MRTAVTRILALLAVVTFTPAHAQDCPEPCSDTQTCIETECVDRYEDCGNGTVADLETGLVWQKTDTNGGVTDHQIVHRWAGAFGYFLGMGLNATPCFADQCRWRIPSGDELRSILHPDTNLAPRIDEEVFGPVTYPNGRYWTSSENAYVNFDDGTSGTVGLFTPAIYHVRAVRDGNCSDPPQPCRACGDFDGSSTLRSTDALGILRAAVTGAICEACECDISGNGSVTAADALALLRYIVDHQNPLSCPQE